MPLFVISCRLSMIKFIGTAQKDNEALLYYYQSKGGQHFFKVITSSDGFSFTEKSKYVIVTDDNQKKKKKILIGKVFALPNRQTNTFLPILPRPKHPQP